MCGRGVAIGARRRECVDSTASAITFGVASMPVQTTVSGVIITVSGDGGGVYTASSRRRRSPEQVRGRD